MVRRPFRQRRAWFLVLATVGLMLLAVAATTLSFALTGTGRASSDLPVDASSKPVAGVPDVTGADTTHGTVTLAALQAGAPGTTVTASSIRIGGLQRGYLLVAPSVSRGSVPLIVVLGGVNASPTQEAFRDEFLPLVERGAAALVYPAGYGQSWNAGVANCCGPAVTAGVDDFAFVAAVINALHARMHITVNYLVGFSNGGKFSYQLICREPSLFKAMAVVAASPLAICAAQVPRPVLIAVGAKDTELPQEAKAAQASTVLTNVLSTWGIYDGCPQAAAMTTTTGSAQITSWALCLTGKHVEGVLYGTLDHEWPTAGLVGPDVAGASLIWQFLTSN